MKGYLIILFFMTGTANASEVTSNKYTIDSDNQLWKY